MNPKIKNLLVRTVAGAVYVALMILGIYNPLLMCVLLGLFAVLAIFEYANLLSGPVDKSTRIAMSVVALLTITLPTLLLYAAQYLEWYRLWMLLTLSNFLDIGFFPLLTIIIFVVVFMLFAIGITTFELFRRRPCPIEQIGKSLFGLCWIVLPLVCLQSLTFWDPNIALLFLLLIWCNDTFAYLGGSLLGYHKMFERVSPKKTWEGTIVGFLMTCIVAFLLNFIPMFHDTYEYWGFTGLNFSGTILLCFVLVVVLFGTLGDLLESLFKRNAGVKDSGRVIPGHGGVLDRFDSILFAIIPVMLFLFVRMLYLIFNLTAL